VHKLLVGKSELGRGTHLAVNVAIKTIREKMGWRRGKRIEDFLSIWGKIKKEARNLNHGRASWGGPWGLSKGGGGGIRRGSKFLVSGEKGTKIESDVRSARKRGGTAEALRSGKRIELEGTSGRKGLTRSIWGILGQIWLPWKGFTVHR